MTRSAMTARGFAAIVTGIVDNVSSAWRIATALKTGFH